MRVLDDVAHEEFGIDDAVFVGQHPPCDSEDGTEDADVEEDSPAGRDLKVQERVRVDQREEDEDRGKRSGEEGDEARQEDRLGFRVVVDVLISERVRLRESLLKVMRQFIELAELPPRERRELSRADRGGVLVVFLGEQEQSAPCHARPQERLGRLTSK